ncbi:hypothetical protein PGQ11_001434 [Apiospora arundinis]|uniref:Uncharacterized protein n=1 Tax=Apiospora arundinis TaxID=335852 RepID=A0ABR2JMT3_9PEZI
MARHPKPFVLGTPPSKAERLRDKNKNEYPSPPASKNRKGGPGRKEVEFAKKMAGHPNEIKTQVVKTNLPQKSKCPVETEPMRLAAIKKKKAREAEIRADNKPANIEYMKDCITNAFPSDVDMVVAPNIFWDGGKDMAGYFE